MKRLYIFYIFLIVFSIVLILIYHFFLIVGGPLRGQVFDAVTQKPIVGIKIGRVTEGETPGFNFASAGSPTFRPLHISTETTDSDGKFAFPPYIVAKSPFETPVEEIRVNDVVHYGRSEMSTPPLSENRI